MKCHNAWNSMINTGKMELMWTFLIFYYNFHSLKGDGFLEPSCLTHAISQRQDELDSVSRQKRSPHRL